MNTAPLGALGEPPAAARKTIPFDVAFRFDLTGEPQRTQRRTVTISVEATFVAVSIGYGVVPRVAAVTFGPEVVERAPGVPNAAALPFALAALPGQRVVTIRDISMGAVIDGLTTLLDDGLPGGEIGPQVAAVMSGGLKINPAFAAHVLGRNTRLDAEMVRNLFTAVAAPADRIQFHYALFDDASGREFQSEPILNTAGLGAATGDRPFRYFARPIVFAPKSTIRLEITEASEFQGALHVSLQGYKVLGGVGTPTGRRGGAPRRPGRRRTQLAEARR
jgi:hypothetical protein